MLCTCMERQHQQTRKPLKITLRPSGRLSKTKDRSRQGFQYEWNWFILEENIFQNVNHEPHDFRHWRTKCGYSVDCVGILLTLWLNQNLSKSPWTRVRIKACCLSAANPDPLIQLMAQGVTGASKTLYSKLSPTRCRRNRFEREFQVKWVLA